MTFHDEKDGTEFIRDFEQMLNRSGRPPRKKFTVTGTAKVTKMPSTISVRVTVRGQGADRARAYEAFQNRLKAFADAIAGQAEHRVSAPAERDVPDPKGKPTNDRFTVTATVHVSIGLDAFGGVLQALIEQDLAFDKPTFEFDADAISVAELAGKAATAARNKAEAIAAGAGFSIGSVLGVDCGDARISEPKLVYQERERERERWQGLILQSRAIDFVTPRMANLFGRGESELEPEAPELDKSILGLLNTDMPTQEQSATVTIEYEIRQIEVAA